MELKVQKSKVKKKKIALNVSKSSDCALNFLPVLVGVHLLGGHDLEVDLLVEVVGVEEGVAGGAHRLREGGAVVAVADVAHRAIGGQECGGHLKEGLVYM